MTALSRPNGSSDASADRAQADVFRAWLHRQIENTSAKIVEAERNRNRATTLGQTSAERYHRNVERDLRTELYELHRQDQALAERFTPTRDTGGQRDR